MYSILKHTHMTFILLAIVIFILRFFWLKSGHENAQKAVYKKIHLHTHLTIIVLGLALMGLLHFNPFVESGYWLLEKLIAFVAYFAMVQVALNEKTKKHIQWLAFIGAFGWLAYIAKLAFTKQAILLVG
ncbi:SirB2 family protein [uncultured Psychromonas sp.]|uniref:SirB2 family protein n=1 Tax=uncultured Psychromonas sp. TaxID=173974 RepID=UPI0026041AFC|nr:SirB2 family protein [uncultured Psychromonas sp.]